MAASSGRRCRARQRRQRRRKPRASRRAWNPLMRHRNYGSKLGRQPAHRRATLRNLVTNVIERERITTTLTRAKAARPLVEQMITLGKRDTLHARRQAASYLMTPVATKKLFADIAPRFADRTGGYTRIVRAGFRVGDGPSVAILELLGSKLRKKEKKEKRGKENLPAQDESPEGVKEGLKKADYCPIQSNASKKTFRNS